mmetsp:Transcript_49423/g.137354  ORF Transcript_49423/g.137354 Transcript_49423/m.137354 type:complete len:413 (+) Transcript_49423:556-1794(+)
MMRPTITAMQRSSQTVITVTSTTTVASIQLMRRMRTRELHAKVFSAMSTMSPTSAATGICAMMGASRKTLRPRVMPMTAPETRLRPPLPTFSRDCAMRAQPPCVPKSEERMLPTPWPKHSRLMEPLVPVIWSINASVMRLSSRPTMAKRTAVEMTLAHMWPSCHCTPAGGKSQDGMVLKPPRNVSVPATSFRVRRGMTSFNRKAKTAVRISDAKGAGKTLPAYGIRAQIQAAVMANTAVMVMLMIISFSTQGPSPRRWYCRSWARIMTMARPLTKPSITECGIRVMSCESLNAAAMICRTPTMKTHRAMGPIPSSGSSETRARTTAVAAEALEIMPGRPPASAAEMPTMHPAQMPFSGEAPVMKENEMASGRTAMAVEKPARMFCRTVPSSGSSRRFKAEMGVTCLGFSCIG